MPFFNGTIAREPTNIFGEILSVKSFGAVGDGVTDDTVAIQTAITQAKAFGGKSIKVPTGTYLINGVLNFGSGAHKLLLHGEGHSSIIKKGAGDIVAGSALINGTGATDVEFRDLCIDGSATSITRLTYGAGSSGTNFNNDPMNDKLTKNSLMWWKQDCQRITFRGVKFKNCQAYVGIFDSRLGNLEGITIEDCDIEDSLCHLFGDSGADMNYGSWTGGFLFQNDCSSNSFVLTKVKIHKNRFKKINGNCIWMHSYGFTAQNKDFIITNNNFDYIGRDSVLVGNLDGATVSGNVTNHTGYVVLTPGASPTRAALPNHYAVSYDSSGYATNIVMSNNVTVNFNGGGFDLDGLRNSQVINNILASSEPLARGIQTGDTSVNGGGVQVSIIGNSIFGCNNGSIILNQARNCVCKNNTIQHPALAVDPPILLYSLNKLTDKTIVSNNTIIYPQPVQWGVVESDASTGTGFDSTIVNYVYDNRCFGNKGEFLSHPASSSSTAIGLSTSDSSAVTKQQSSIERVGNDATSKIAITDTKNTTTNEYFSFGLKGGELVVSGMLGILAKDAASPIYDDAIADTYDSNTTLVRANKTDKKLEVSFEKVSGSRVWVDVGSGSGATFAIDRAIPFINGTTLSESNKLTWQDTAGGNFLNIVRKSAGQTNNLLEFRHEGGATLMSVVDKDGIYFGPTTATNAFLGASRTDYTLIGKNAVRFAQTSGDQAEAGVLEYRPVGLDSNTLQITGVGTTTSDRVVLVRDYLGVTGVTGQASINVRAGYINSAQGLASIATSYNTVNIPNGGVLGKAMLAISYSKMGLTSVLPGAGGGSDPLVVGDSLTTGTFCFNDVNNRPEYYDGASWQPFGAGGSAPGSDGQIVRNLSGSFGANADLSFDSTNKRLEVYGLDSFTDQLRLYANNGATVRYIGMQTNAAGVFQIRMVSPGYTGNLISLTDISCVIGRTTTINGTSSGSTALGVTNGYVDCDTGFYTGYTGYESVKVPSGGVRAKSIRAERYMQMGVFAGTLGAPDLTAGDGFSQGLFYYNSALGQPVYYNGSSFVSFGGGGGAVTSVSGSGNITVSPTTGACVVSITATPTFTSVSAGTLTSSGACNVASLSVSGSSLLTGSVSALGGISTTSVSASSVTATGAITANNYYISDGGFFTGQDYLTRHTATGFDVYTYPGLAFLGSFTDLIFKGGILVSVN